MVKKLGNYEIPFDKDGNQMDYPYGYHLKEWKPNEIFEDILTYSSYSKGRSSIGFEFVRSSGAAFGTTVNVFATDMDIFIPHIVNGQITGKFCFVKRGASYGCTLFEG